MSSRASLASSGGKAAPVMSSRKTRPADARELSSERSGPTPPNPAESLEPERAPSTIADHPSWDR
eukprot:12437466-Alexandrium_andersonii.AAC.1